MGLTRSSCWHGPFSFSVPLHSLATRCQPSSSQKTKRCQPSKSFPIEIQSLHLHGFHTRTQLNVQKCLDMCITINTSTVTAHKTNKYIPYCGVVQHVLDGSRRETENYSYPPKLARAYWRRRLLGFPPMALDTSPFRQLHCEKAPAVRLDGGKRDVAPFGPSARPFLSIVSEGGHFCQKRWPWGQLSKKFLWVVATRAP